MNVKAFYESIEGDYETTIGRLMSDSLIERLLLKYPNDKSMSELIDGMNENDCTKAFNAVHTLKGTALNLGFSKLTDSASRLTEVLRANKMDESHALYLEVKNDYDTVINAINNNQ